MGEEEVVVVAVEAEVEVEEVDVDSNYLQKYTCTLFNLCFQRG